MPAPNPTGSQSGQRSRSAWNVAATARINAAGRSAASGGKSASGPTAMETGLLEATATAQRRPTVFYHDREQETRPSFRPFAHGHAAYRRRPHGAVQLALCAPHR